MNKAKKVGIFVLAVLMLGMGSVSIFAGGTKETTVDDGVFTIRILPQCDGPVDEDSRLVAWEEAYLEEKLGFPIKFNFMYLDRSNLVELLNLRLAAGDIPDVFRGYPDSQFRDFINQGVLRSYDPMKLKEIAPNLYEQITKHGGEGIWNFGKGPDGKFYGVPGTSVLGRYPYVPVWRDDWLKNVGIDKIPETLEEAEKAFYAFVNDDPDGNGKKDTYALSDKGMAVIFGAFGGLPPYKGGQGIKWTLVDGKIDASVTTDDMKAAVTLLAKWYKDGLIDPEWITGENKGQYWGNAVAFWNGTIGFSQPGMYYHVLKPEQTTNPDGSNNYKQFHALQGEDASYVDGPLLIGPEGKYGSYQWGVVEGWYAVHGKDVTDEQLEKWWQICELLITDGYLQDASWFGVPEVDWTYNADGTINMITNVAEATTSASAALGITGNGIDRISSLGWDFKAVQRRLNSKELQFAKKATSKTPLGLPNLVWGDYPSKSVYIADVQSMVIEAYIDFITGQRDVATEWDKFVADVNKAGLTELTKDAQIWYDTYH